MLPGDSWFYVTVEMFNTEKKIIAGCKLFRHVEKYSKSRFFDQHIKPSSMYSLKASLINSHSSIEKYFGDSWVKSLVSS